MEYLEILAKYPAIDLQQFKRMEEAEVSDALSELKSVIELRFNQIASELIRTKRVKGCDPEFSFDPEFATAMYKNWNRFLMTRTMQVELKKYTIASAVLPLAVYLHDCYGVSCSQYLLGQDMSVRLPSHLQTWLEIVMSLNRRERHELDMIFANCEPVRQETLFVLKSRLTEYCNSIGCSLKSFLTFSGMKSWDRKLRWAFAELPLTETGNGYGKQRPYIGATSLVRLLMYNAVHLDLSPDYFLLQDYSEYIVDAHGEPYSDEERELISKLLRSGSRTSTAAVGFVNACFARRLERIRISDN